ncbi:MAG: guanylate kinase [Clostridia bacterium]|nr:guanylate kinase [Clostridia bacterium]
MRKGSLIVLSGPSGVGKGTIYAGLLKIMPDLTVSVSATTRAPRPGEIHGKHYYFITRDEFNKMKDNGEFLEWAQTVGNCYATPKAPVMEKLASGYDVLLEIDVKGAKQVKKAYPECKTIFVLPPSREELARRLRGRGTESEEQISARLALATSELEESGSFDYEIINSDIDKAIADVKEIIEKTKE